MLPPPPRSTLFPYTTLFRSNLPPATALATSPGQCDGDRCQLGELRREVRPADIGRQDRKSTRLDSSHVAISYAVFCLKKKKSLTRNKYKLETGTIAACV